MKSLMLLWQSIANESAMRCCTSATIDFNKVEGRVKHEGLSFLTITLPNFGKDFERSLDQGKVDRSLFQGFSWKGGLPRFLGGFLDLVFDRSSGVLLDEPSIDAILAIRQLTLMFGKMLVPCSDARKQAAMERFIECEQEVRDNQRRISSSDMEDFSRIGRLLYGDLCHDLDLRVFDRALIPKHGPGATADRLRGNAKFGQRTWTDRLEEYFPFMEYALPNSSFMDELDGVDFLEPGSEIPVRVISVPKTLKTPRIIAIEPTAMQYAQQAVYDGLLEKLMEDPLLRSLIGFDDQTPNQRMAAKGSLSGNLATLDLSEASDRVSNQLVRALLVDYPHLHGAVDACRSRKADVLVKDEVRTIRLAKFASMGSALCFPMEAMVFLTLILLGIERELNTPLDLEAVKRLRGKVRVYGDDLIVPVEYVRSVVTVLETFGSRVNNGKSFWTGRFRESCGKEYYAGHDVSIVRVRREFPAQRRDAQEIISLVSLRNQLYWAGYWRTCAMLDDEIRKIIRYFPVVEPSSPVLGRESVLPYQAERTHKHYHSPLVKGYKVDSKPPKDPLDGVDALHKCLLMLERKSRGSEPKFGSAFPSISADEMHLERSGRPHAVNIKLGYGSPF